MSESNQTLVDTAKLIELIEKATEALTHSKGVKTEHKSLEKEVEERDSRNIERINQLRKDLKDLIYTHKRDFEKDLDTQSTAITNMAKEMKEEHEKIAKRQRTSTGILVLGLIGNTGIIGFIPESERTEFLINLMTSIFA